MFCPKCRGEYVDGVATCAHCEVELVTDIPDEDAFASPEAMARALKDVELEAVMVGNHVSLQEAQRGLVQAQIPSVIAGEAELELEPGLHPRFFLMVDAKHLDNAHAYFREQWEAGLKIEGVMFKEEEEGEVVEEGACPCCGTHVPDGASECPECGLFLGDPDAVG